jgi:hypothetical protein
MPPEDDKAKETESTDQKTESKTEQDSEKLIPAEKVEGMIRERLARAKKSWAKQAEPKQEEPGKPEQESKSEKLTRKEVHEMRIFDRQFSRKARELGFDEDAADDLLGTVEADSPEDWQAWLERKAQLFLKNPAESEEKAEKVAEPKTETPALHVPVGSPHKVQSGSGELLDLWQLSREERSALGPTKLREEFEKIVDAARRDSGAPPIPHHPRLKR